MEWLAFVLLAVVLASTREIIQKRELQREHALEFLVVRGIFMIILSLFLIPFIDLSLPWQAYGIMIIVALLAATAVLHRNKALKHTDVSIVQPLMNIQPILVALIAFVFLGETLSLFQTAGVLLIVVGTYLLEIDHSHQGLLGPFKKVGENKYTLFVIFAITIFSITTTLDRYVVTNFTTPITYFFIVWVMISLFLIAWHGIKYRWDNIGTVFKSHGKVIFWPALLSILMSLSLYHALSLAYAGLVIAVWRLQSLITTIEGGLFFHEDHLIKKSAACFVMMIGAAMVIV